MNPNVLYALSAAALFGASTPFAKLLVGNVSPALLAGLLYLGSGLGLGIIRLVRDRAWKASGLKQSEWLWFAGAILFGGVLAPLALLGGLAYATGATASHCITPMATATTTSSNRTARSPSSVSTW